MCFNITPTDHKNPIPCTSAWDIFNTVVAITDNETEAHDVWKKAGRLDINASLIMNDYSIRRVA